MTQAQEPKAQLAVEARGATLLVRIDAGPLQVFGADLARQLEALVERVDKDPDVRAVVLASSHPTRFISHADVKWLQEGGAQYLARQQSGAAAPPPPPDYVGLDRLHALFLRMNSVAAVFVAALEGAALGLGAELAWACDLRVMADSDAFIGQPEVLLGIMPGGGGSQRLTRLLGVHRSLLAILDGKPFTPAQALEIGAVDAVVSKANVVAKAIALADELAKRHKPSLAAIKRSVYFGGSLPLPEGIKLEAKEFLGLDVAEEGQRRMRAYQEQTAARGELPLYIPGGYEAALQAGRTTD
ncbi:enoyl-CoA hydratase/isomerase family protein [Polyangium jinanense]|uniref:Enoyl-CoA hydratase/isomerase family protein n=1 Tax=Polyangium jinanense TaxID=2829994 RepID=A0A9X4APU5_9BACT|nr:enoyl-CoA hydratase/isomerase family protein [Polyangium jinanense]MDC3952774.1 enoyl-CoA hydratase/isomerase family protein [Polyangium jinanense]MDC3980393.1 enoyl-CoA hydratase/isomerase family protein [Polyangium jinanense]